MTDFEIIIINKTKINNINKIIIYFININYVMTLTLKNTNTLTADNIVVSGTDISQIYATKTELDNLNFATDIQILTR